MTDNFRDQVAREISKQLDPKLKEIELLILKIEKLVTRLNRPKRRDKYLKQL